MEALVTDLYLLPIATLFPRLAVDLDQWINRKFGREHSFRVRECLQFIRIFFCSALVAALEVRFHNVLLQLPFAVQADFEKLIS